MAAPTIADRFQRLLLDADVAPYLTWGIRCGFDHQYAQALTDVRADPRVLPTLPVELAAEVAVAVRVTDGPVLHRALWAADPRPEVRERIGLPQPRARDRPTQPTSAEAPTKAGTGRVDEWLGKLGRRHLQRRFGGPGPRGLANVPAGCTASELLASMCDRPMQFAGFTDELIAHAARLCSGDSLTEFEVPVTGALFHEQRRLTHDESWARAKALGAASDALRAVLTPAQLLDVLGRPNCRDLRDRVASDAAHTISDVRERWVRFFESIDAWDGTVGALCDECASVPGTSLMSRRPWDLPEGMVDYDRWEDPAWLDGLRTSMATTGCIDPARYVDHSEEISAGVTPSRAAYLLSNVPTLSRSQMAALDPWLDSPPAQITPDGSGEYVAYYCSGCGPHTLHDPRSRPFDRMSPGFLDLRDGRVRPEGVAAALYPLLRWDWQHPQQPGGCCERKPAAGPKTRAEAVRTYLSLTEWDAAPHVVAAWRWVIARVAPGELVDPWA